MVSTASSSPYYSHPHSSSPSSLPPRKKMSVTQTYFLAHKARAKLSHEAAQPDHNLRLLVGHANLLDSLMVDLAEAEREQESWFNQSVRGASAKTEERHVQWADEVAVEEDWEAESSDSDSDSTDDEDEDVEMADVLPLRRIPSHSVAIPPSPQLHTIMDEDEDEDDFEDDDEDYGDLSLTRTSSRSVTSPPELEHDSDSSEDESMPPSPPTASIPTFTQKQNESTVQYYDSRQEEEDNKAEFYSEGYYLPPRNPARIVSTISVY
ncbi:hypothetical protein F4818DRAFT_398939 [Hypoxylon cercidicola]|nr:hypothetical protein F4818DRAFT_398939 [Hypoxylon cercidicola]